MAINATSNIANQLTSNISRLSESLAKSQNKIGSGKKILTASDNAANLAIMNELTKQSNALIQASRNTNTAVSSVNVAMGGLSNISDTLTQMQTLALQAADGSLNSDQRAMLNTEFTQLSQQIDQTASSTKYNGQDLLGGAATSTTYQVGTGTNANDQLSINYGGVSTGTLGIGGSSLATQGNAQSAIDAISQAQNTTMTRMAEYGANRNQLNVIVDNTNQSFVASQSALSSYQDTNIVEELSATASQTIMSHVSMSILGSAITLQSKLTDFMRSI